MAADWKQIVTGTQKLGEFTTKAAGAARAKFNEAIPIIVSADVVQMQYAKIAKHDGFKQCSRV